MPRPYCVESTAVKVSVDELMTELLRVMGTDQLAEVLFRATQGATKRLRPRRHNRYKSEKLFRRAAKRLPDIPPHLASAVGLKTQIELVSPDISVEPVKPTPQSEEETREIEAADEQVMHEFLDGIDDEPTPEPSSLDEFADLMDVPRFEDYEAVFASYPYVWETLSKSGERRLVLGYASARNRTTDDLVRRNCAYTGADGIERPFNDLPSEVGLLKKAAQGVRRHLKVLPYHVGAKVRFWTNVAGKGDREDLYRYVLITEDGLVKVKTRAEFDAA